VTAPMPGIVINSFVASLSRATISSWRPRSAARLRISDIVPRLQKRQDNLRKLVVPIQKLPHIREPSTFSKVPDSRSQCSLIRKLRSRSNLGKNKSSSRDGHTIRSRSQLHALGWSRRSASSDDELSSQGESYLCEPGKLRWVEVVPGEVRRTIVSTVASIVQERPMFWAVAEAGHLCIDLLKSSRADNISAFRLDKSTPKERSAA